MRDIAEVDQRLTDFPVLLKAMQVKEIYIIFYLRRNNAAVAGSWLHFRLHGLVEFSVSLSLFTTICKQHKPRGEGRAWSFGNIVFVTLM